MRIKTAKRAVLAYSGGLDTSVIVPWLGENYGCEVVTFTADLGQGADELDGLEEKAIASGPSKAYVMDLREDNEALFDVLDTHKLELSIVTGVIRTLKIEPGNMAAALEASLSATDLADYLVRRGVPFRQSHHLVGQAVQRAEELGITLRELELREYHAIHPAFAPDLSAVLASQRSVEARNVPGGTAPQAVRAQITEAKALLIASSQT